MKRLLVVLMVGFSAFAASAQTLSLSLADARRIAKEENRSLQNASLDVQQARAQRWQAIAQMLPQAQFDLNYFNMFNYKMDFNGMSISMPPYGTLGVSVSAAVNGQMVMAAIMKKLAMEMQDINRQNSEQQIDAQVVQIYSSVQVMKEIVGLLQESKNNVEELHKMSQKAVEVGVSEQTTADQIEIRLNTLENSIRSTERNASIYMNSLKLALGMSADTTLVLTTPLTEILNAETTLTLLGTDFDIQNNYGWQLTQQNTKLAKQQVTLAKLAYTPTFSVAYQYNNRKTFSDEATFNMTMPHTFTMGLSVPLWSSGNKAAGVTEKKLALQAAQNTETDTHNQLMVQDQQLRYNLSTAYETYENEKKNIEVVRRVMQSTSNKFTQGVASSQELVTASNDLISAENSYAQAALSLIQAQVELRTFLNK